MKDTTESTLVKLNSGRTPEALAAQAQVDRSFSAGMDKRLELAQLADAGTDIVQLRGKDRHSVAHSFPLYLRAIGVPPGTLLTKDDRQAHSAAFHTLRQAFIAAEGIGTVTMHGTAAEVVKLGKARLSGSDAFGMPTEAKRAATLRYSPTVREIGDWLAEQDAKQALRKTGFARLLATK